MTENQSFKEVKVSFQRFSFSVFLAFIYEGNEISGDFTVGLLILALRMSVETSSVRLYKSRHISDCSSFTHETEKFYPISASIKYVLLKVFCPDC